MSIKSLATTFAFLFLLQAALAFFGPGLCLNRTDSTLLTLATLALALVFLWGSYRIEKGLGVSQSRFNALFFGMMGLRMMTALILILIYLVISDITNIKGVIFLICNYFVYMGFEIKFILPKLRSDSEKSKNSGDARK